VASFTALLLVVVNATGAFAATVTVTTTTDESNATDGQVSLREAIQSINNGTDTGADVTAHRTGTYGTNDTVVVPANANHYALSAGEISITKQLVIQGAGASSSVIDASGGSFRVFHVMAGVGSGTVTLQAVTITGGSDTAPPGGGGILVDSGGGNLVLANAAVTGNAVNVSMGGTGAGGGGGIYNAGGTTTVTGSSISSNTATVGDTGSCCHGGGGLYGRSGAITVTGSHLDGTR
jgi:CSLREA domain-containing protein